MLHSFLLRCYVLQHKQLRRPIEVRVQSFRTNNFSVFVFLFFVSFNVIIRSKFCNIHRTNQIFIFILIVHEFIQSIKWFQLSFIVILRKSRWIKLFDRPVRRYDPDFKPLPHEFFLEHKRPRPASPWFYLYLPRDEALLTRMRKFSILVQHCLSICRSFAFTK